MSDKFQKTPASSKISEKERWKYIGFDVFPGEPKDLFQSEDEKKKLVEGVRARLAHHEHLRTDCTLLEERVSASDRMFLAIASVVVVLALFLPWYSVYNEIVETGKPAQSLIETTSLVGTAETATAGATSEVSPAVPGVTDTGLAAAVEPAGGAEIGTEELITTVSARKKIHREYEKLSGLGGIISIGSVAKVFSSGLSLLLSGFLFIVFTLLCIALPIYNLYGIYGTKGNPDVIALKLKKMLRLNWIPLLVYVVCLGLSFLGGEYSFDAAKTFTSLGAGYSPLAYFGTLSWGVYVSLAGFILCAAKGVEI